MLRIRVLGELAVELDGTPVSLPPGRRIGSLLAWLATHPGPRPRARLAATFWPEVPDSNARASLRSAVWALRAAFGPPAGHYLRTTRDTVGLCGDLWVDVTEFDRLRAAGAPEDAVALCRGDLLAAHDDEWVLTARDEHARHLAAALAELAGAAERAGEPDRALGWARRRADLDPLDEDAGREAARLHAATGDITGARRALARLTRTLRGELGVAPTAATLALAARLSPLDEPVEPAAAGPVADLPLVGRETDFRRLERCWRWARAGAGTAVVLAGDGGIGKTRLAEELLATARRQGAHTAGCAPGALGGAPYELWSELLADALADADPLPAGPGWATDLARLLPAAAAHAGPAPPAADPQHDRIRLFEAVVELIAVLAARRPLVLLLEDLHLADASSLELIGYAGRRIARLPVLLVLTRRTLPPRPPVDGVLGALRARGVLRVDLTLPPLPPDAVRRLVHLVARPSEPQLARIVAVAGGNPLLAVEAGRQLARGDPAEGLRTATRSTLTRLSPEAKLFIELVAVAGRELARAEVASLPLLTDPDRAATEALGAGLLRTREGSVGFRHENLRQAVYDDIADPERVRLHDAFAAELRRRDRGTDRRRAAELARHLRLAGHRRQAAGQLARAGAAARAVAALTEAAEFLRQATELDPDDTEPLVELAEVQAWRGLLDESDLAFNRAIDLIPPMDTGALIAAWLRRGRWLRGGICHPRESRRSYQIALDILDREPDADPMIRAEALAGMAWAESVAGDPDAVAELLREVDAMTGRSGDDLLAHDIGAARGQALLRAGRFTDSYGPLIAASAAAGRAGRPDMAYSCLTNAASAAACAGQLDRALDFVDRCVPLVVRNGLLRLVIYTYTGRAALLRRLNRPAEARAAIDLAAEAADRLGIPALDGLIHQERGLLALSGGDPATAAHELGRALDADAPVSRPLARLYRAEALTMAGRVAEAEAELRAVALEPVSDSDFPDTLVARMQRVQGLIARQAGDHRLAAVRLRQAAEVWRHRAANSAPGDRYVANMVDLGRPPLAVLVEPDREHAAVLAELAEVSAGSGASQTDTADSHAQL